MKIIQLSYSDLTGGAAIAAHRTHQALMTSGIDSTMHVNRKVSDDWTVRSPYDGKAGIVNRLRPMIGRVIPQLFFKDREKNLRSYNWLPSRWPDFINSSDADIVHLHWVNSETMSVRDIARINKPTVMTMHDMWAFSGAEHYPVDTRYIDGYSAGGKRGAHKGVDIDRWTWKRKQRFWSKNPAHIVAISEWMASCASASALFKDRPVTVIPNPIDTSVWKPLNKAEARRAFNLPADKKILTFGALRGTGNPRKGYSLLVEALTILAEKQGADDIHVVVFGQGEPENRTPSAFPTTYAGRFSDPVAMSLLNSAADVFVNPATQEAFGLTALEAQACGLPVVAFANTGVADVVSHGETGYLARHANPEDLAIGIAQMLSKSDHEAVSNDALPVGLASRNRAISLFSYEAVAEKYNDLYQKVLNAQ